jgi:hypothetical protein
MSTSKITIHIVQENIGGISQDPELFYSEELAGIHFQKIVTGKKVRFRTRNENETWSDYHNAFHEYTYSPELPYHPADWEVHWFKPVPNDDQIITANFHTITEPFDEVEVHPCRYIDNESVEQCEPAQANFWSTYVHFTAGGLDCVADFATQELAEQFRTFLKSIIDKSESDQNSVNWSVTDFEERAIERELDEMEESNPELHKQITYSETHIPIPPQYVLFDRSKFKTALATMIRKHDANNGITWDTIDYYLDEHCSKRAA